MGQVLKAIGKELPGITSTTMTNTGRTEATPDILQDIGGILPSTLIFCCAVSIPGAGPMCCLETLDKG